MIVCQQATAANIRDGQLKERIQWIQKNPKWKDAMRDVLLRNGVSEYEIQTRLNVLEGKDDSR